MKKMNKSYLLTALGVLTSPLLTTNANADLFKCVACTNKPAYAYYTSSGTNTSDCSWKCGIGFDMNESSNKCVCNDGYIKTGSAVGDVCVKTSSSSSSSGTSAGGCGSGSTSTFTCPSGQYKPTSKNVCCANNLSGTLTSYSSTVTSSSSNIGGTSPINCSGYITSSNGIKNEVTHCSLSWTYNSKNYTKTNLNKTLSYPLYICNDKILDSNGNAI